MAAPAKGTMNLAARMGRWSAQHRKTAIWGWLVFVFLAFAIGGGVGRRPWTAPSAASASRGARTAPSTTPSRSTRRDGARPERQRERERPVLPRRSATPQRRLEAVPYTQAFESPYAAGNSRPRSRPTAAPRCFASRSPATTTRPRSASAPVAGRRPARRRPPIPASPSASSATPASHKQLNNVDQQRLQAGARHLAADHAPDPPDRLRRPGGRRRSAAAWADGGARDDRARSA